MNQKINVVSLKKILMIWIGFSILLAFAGMFVFGYVNNGKTFFVMANILNLFFLLLYFLFRTNIEKIIANLINESSNLSFNIECKYDKRIGYTIIFLFIIICSIIIFFAIFDIEGYRFLISEDGVIEYGSAIFWFLSAIIMCYHMLMTSKREFNKHQLFFNMVLMAFFIVCGGEEISWGQRLISIKTPDLISSVNVQNEITLHNIGSISVFSNAFFVLTAAFFLCVPFLIRKNDRIKSVLYFLHFPTPNRFAIYVYVGSLLIWLFVGIRFGTLGFHPFSFFPEQYYNQMDDEVFEFCAAYSFFCFSILNSRTQFTMVQNHQQEA